ncbi:MAG: hypothetical protein ACLRHW_18930 [Coprobacillus cateniformis]
MAIPLSNSVKILFDVFQITNQDKCKTSVLNALKMIIIFQKVKMIFFITKLQSLRNHYNKLSAQIILKWLNQNKTIAILKSAYFERTQENYAIQNFNLSLGEMTQIEQVNTHINLILDMQSVAEVERLHHIHFIQ